MYETEEFNIAPSASHCYAMGQEEIRRGREQALKEIAPETTLAISRLIQGLRIQAACMQGASRTNDVRLEVFEQQFLTLARGLDDKYDIMNFFLAFRECLRLNILPIPAAIETFTIDLGKLGDEVSAHNRDIEENAHRVGRARRRLERARAELRASQVALEEARTERDNGETDYLGECYREAIDGIKAIPIAATSLTRAEANEVAKIVRDADLSFKQFLNLDEAPSSYDEGGHKFWDWKLRQTRNLVDMRAFLRDNE